MILCITNISASPLTDTTTSRQEYDGGGEIPTIFGGGGGGGLDVPSIDGNTVASASPLDIDNEPVDDVVDDVVETPIVAETVLPVEPDGGIGDGAGPLVPSDGEDGEMMKMPSMPMGVIPGGGGEGLCMCSCDAPGAIPAPKGRPTIPSAPMWQLGDLPYGHMCRVDCECRGDYVCDNRVKRCRNKGELELEVVLPNSGKGLFDKEQSCLDSRDCKSGLLCRPDVKVCAMPMEEGTQCGGILFDPSWTCASTLSCVNKRCVKPPPGEPAMPFGSDPSCEPVDEKEKEALKAPPAEKPSEDSDELKMFKGGKGHKCRGDCDCNDHLICRDDIKICGMPMDPGTQCGGLGFDPTWTCHRNLTCSNRRCVIPKDGEEANPWGPMAFNVGPFRLGANCQRNEDCVKDLICRPDIKVCAMPMHEGEQCGGYGFDPTWTCAKDLSCVDYRCRVPGDGVPPNPYGPNQECPTDGPRVPIDGEVVPTPESMEDILKESFPPIPVAPEEEIDSTGDLAESPIAAESSAPVEEEITADVPALESPVEEIAPEVPALESPVAEEPAVESPVAEEPAVESPIDEAAVEEIAPESPVAEVPVAESPAAPSPAESPAAVEAEAPVSPSPAEEDSSTGGNEDTNEEPEIEAEAPAQSASPAPAGFVAPAEGDETPMVFGEVPVSENAMIDIPEDENLES